jgi:hypothetical protein
MALRSAPRRAAVVTVALLGLLAAAVPHALAALGGRGQGTQAVSSGTFAVTPVTAGTSTPSPPLAFAVLPVPAYLDALNTGTVPVVGMTYAVSFVYSGLGTPSLTLTACPGGTWNTVTGVCSATAVVVGSWTPGSTSTVVVGAGNLPTAYPAAVGARLPLKATVSGASLTVAATATVSLSVSSGPTRQVRTATTTER